MIKSNPGEKQALLCALLQFLNFYGTGVAYVVTTSTCMRYRPFFDYFCLDHFRVIDNINWCLFFYVDISEIQKSDCYHKQGHEASCEYNDNLYMILFGVIQIVMSQIPDFHSMKWVSFVAAIMSFCYSSIGFGLGIAKVIGTYVFTLQAHVF